MTEPLVLFLEPDRERRQALSQAFEQAGFPCVGVGSAEAASNASLVSPSLLVISLLGGDPPLTLLDRWREVPRGAGIPVLALTPEGDARAALEAMDAGADDWCAWPTDPGLLRARLRVTERTGALRREVEGIGPLLATIVDALEAREPFSAGHAGRVADLCARTGRAVGLSPVETDRASRAAWIHDIGLVAIPHDILAAERPLTAEETALVRAHPVVGRELLKAVPSLEPLAPFVLGHHERIDGSGYPSGLTRGEIPLSVQLLALADAYAALTAPRPYRDERSHASAVDTLREEARKGTWDEELVQRFAAAVSERA